MTVESRKWHGESAPRLFLFCIRTRQLEIFGRFGQRENVVFEIVRRKIMDQVDQSGLVVNEQYRHVILVETVIGEFSFHGIPPVAGV